MLNDIHRHPPPTMYDLATTLRSATIFSRFTDPQLQTVARRPAPGVLHHSDRGSQYASQACQDHLTAHGMTCSMSRKGNCWDNARTTSWFNSLKNERIYGNRNATRAEVTAETFDYIEVFFNRRRRHSSLG